MKTFFLIIGFILFTFSANAQLISPGKLIKGHQFLEGINQCTSCHELGKKGISNEKCLDCHTPIQQTLDEKGGFHSQKENVTKNCASCHKDHFGEQFDNIRFDSTAFDHNKTAFALIGKHLDVHCATCHTSDFQKQETLIQFEKKHGVTHSGFLGLKMNCESCHETDSPHRDQFVGKQCMDCHSEKGWDNLEKFDHQNTKFALLGKHLDVKCESCHKPQPNFPETIQYAGLEFSSCVSCHEDVHKGRLDYLSCKSCHNETSFHHFVDFPEKTFPHEETGYQLVGSHSTANCSSCHGLNNPKDKALYSMSWTKPTMGYSYPHPVSDNCQSCHVDVHQKRFIKDGKLEACTTCHNQEKWQPSLFGLQEHANRSKFSLTGAHIATPCFQCHDTGNGVHDFPNFSFVNQECEVCHAKNNPHGKDFVNENGKTLCEDCHTTQAWNLSEFNHDATKFPLTRKHQLITCESCHKQEVENKVSFKMATFECESCHKKDDPHQGQFIDSNIGSTCNLCHDTQQFTIATFDHEKTRFSLKGAHENLSCANCHKQEINLKGEEFTRFVPLSSQCSSCHENKK